jgi:hypothetical protein
MIPPRRRAEGRCADPLRCTIPTRTIPARTIPTRTIPARTIPARTTPTRTTPTRTMPTRDDPKAPGRSADAPVPSDEALRRRVEALESTLYARIADDDAAQHEIAQLYVASYQLHAATNFREVVQVICEVLINLVGVARFALFLHDVPRALLVPIAAEGLELAGLASVRVGDGVIGAAAARCVRYDRPGESNEGPIAVLPLLTADGLVGVLVMEELLGQKDRLVAIDEELFALLTTHAASALSSALLREQAPPALRVLDVDVARTLLG